MTETGTAPGDALRLDPIEARVLASLIEKEMTTPEYYPLTLKALTAACNQRSNRNPVLSLQESEVTEALDRLRYDQRLIWHVDEAGSRVAKYKHAVLDRFNFNPHELAVLCELMLRGPQTQGELRAHCTRLTPFESVEQVGETLRDLADWDGAALVVRLLAGPGRREPRYAHRLCGEEPLSADASAEADPPAELPPPARQDRMTQLEEQVKRLQEELGQLQSEFARFRDQFE